MKNKNLLYIAGGLALAAGAYYAFFKKPATEVDTTLPPLLPPPATPPATLPPATTPTPEPAALVVGDVVKAKNKLPMLTENLGVFTAGGSNGKGEVEAGLYAGTIIGFYTGMASGTNYAKLQTFTNRPKDNAGNLVSVYLTPTSNLTK